MKKRILTLFLLICLLVSSLGSPVTSAVTEAENTELEAKPQIIASDDFSDGLSGWANEYGDDFFVLGQKLNVSADSGANMSVAAAGDISIDNGEITFKMNIKNGGYFAVMPRYIDDSTFYSFKFYPSKNQVILQKKVNGGSFTDVKSARFSLNTNHDYEVHISLSGIKISLSVDGTQVLSCEDTSISVGRLAFGAYESDAYVDDILVYRMPEVDYEANAVAKETKKI